jgi:hypothetical protein
MVAASYPDAANTFSAVSRMLSSLREARLCCGTVLSERGAVLSGTVLSEIDKSEGTLVFYSIGKARIDSLSIGNFEIGRRFVDELRFQEE